MPEYKTQQSENEEGAWLSAVPFFAGLPAASLCRLAKDPLPMNLDRGTVIFNQGHATTDVHVVLDGWIKLFRTDEAGTETIIRIAGSGEVLGHDDLLLQQCHQMCAEAVSVVRVLILDGKRLLQFIRRDPAIALRAAASLAQQVQLLTKHIEELKRFDARQRTAHFLLGLCGEPMGKTSFLLPYEKAVIAGWLGMKPASFSRALASLRRFGVTVDRDIISVADARRLAALVQMSPRQANP